MTPDEIEQLRALTDGAVGLTNEQIVTIFLAEGSMNAAAAYIWRTKAATYSSMVDISESGSSRSMGDLYKNALAMADSFVPAAAAAAAGPKMSRRAVRR